MTLHMPVGYVENPQPAYFHDDPTETRGIIFQPDVYAMAEFLADATGHRSIVDVGCGWGDKLAAMARRHHAWQFVGVDYGPNIEHCRQRWADLGILWVDQDLEVVERIHAGLSIVVCSDVVEHLKDPLPLLRALVGSGAAYIVISTPERDVEHGYDHRGPSPNPCHVREWNAHELHTLLTDVGLNVRWHGLTRGSDQGWAMGTQLVIAEVPR